LSTFGVSEATQRRLSGDYGNDGEDPELLEKQRNIESFLRSNEPFNDVWNVSG
jgi:hypothetical protein